MRNPLEPESMTPAHRLEEVAGLLGSGQAESSTPSDADTVTEASACLHDADTAEQ